MAELPASVRVALWATLALGGELSIEDAAARALPDLDHVEGLADRLGLWADLGERMVLVALPRPGDLTGMPRGPLGLSGAAAEAGECVFVPGLGGALVPTLERYGPPGDQGWAIRWEHFDSEPVDPDVLAAHDPGQAELELRTELARLSESLAAVPGTPAGAPGGASPRDDLARAARDAADDVWGLPEGLPPRIDRVIRLAGRILAIATIGLDERLQTHASAPTLLREERLRAIQHLATRHLAAATRAGCVALAAGSQSTRR